ncbi:mitochondrial CCA tRNA nucleotidyltransferase [Rhypophila decipiens]|uniref:Mitochondrial CCA tRNA nucleotidyltransferase n=1 Tax=Rhypophila decipiens TaxID=261697 RepID=A0AAN6YBN6_9PEZI|nr:mitochondrial CCA tRNA nucleotidyltransferase [Rhypophila decipiens]
MSSQSTTKLPVITLTEKEKQLRDLLLDVAKAIDAGPSPSTSQTDDGNDAPSSSEDKVLPEPVILRWAGGWVRDKILGIASHDIDTAINCMTGESFALRLQEFCFGPAYETQRQKHGINGKDDIGGLHKIAKNPEKSKHLETTTVRLFGLDVDFVNLRKETYTQESRNPTMEFGTAEEDALRRDATVNALFYNLNTGEVEDFTGGVGDLEGKLIRTPLEPFQTFMDDPLRVLRLVRFASRLGFRIDEDAERVMGDGRVLSALRVKISRERIGIELEKMLRHENACDALRRIHKLDLYATVFTDPAREGMMTPDLGRWSAVYEALDGLERSKTAGSMFKVLVTGEEARYYAWALAALVPWEQIPDEPPVKKGKLAVPLAAQVAREGFRAPNKLFDLVASSHRHRQAIVELKRIALSDDEKKRERDRFGMAIRQWDSRGGHWRLQVLFAVLADIAEAKGASSRESVLREWQGFLDHLVELDVMDAPGIKRLVDGKILCDALGGKPGKWMAEALEIAMAWQLRNPGVEDVSGAVEEVRAFQFNVLLGILISLYSPAVTFTQQGSSNYDVEEAAERFAILVAKGIAPVENHESSKSSDDGDTDMLSDQDTQTKKKFNDLAQRCRFLASPAIAAIRRLLTLTATASPEKTVAPNLDQVLLTLIACTSREHSEEDTWTSPEIAKQADAALVKVLPVGGSSRDQFITGGILERYLRPLFSKTKRPAAITASGRKAAYSDDDDREQGLPDDSWVTKPWKFTDHRAIPVFAWAVDQADEQLIAKHWPLFIPVLLTLTDDSSAAVKSRGLHILSKFLAKFPSKTLLETGLAQVFEDAIFPALSYLPSLTPEDESVRLLAPAFEALRILAGKVLSPTSTKAATGTPTSATAATTGKEKENKLLDRVLREGVFPAYFHAKEHVRIVEVLCQQTVLVLQQMGIHAVKHLKDLIPMISTIMTNPFAPLSPSTLVAAIKALQATLATCWPRLCASPWQDEILNALVICWLNVHDFEHDEPQPKTSNQTADIKQQLKVSASALNAVLKTRAGAAATSDQQQDEQAEDPLDEIISPLVSKEPLLAPLFSHPPRQPRKPSNPPPS